MRSLAFQTRYPLSLAPLPIPCPTALPHPSHSLHPRLATSDPCLRCLCATACVNTGDHGQLPKLHNTASGGHRATICPPPRGGEPGGRTWQHKHQEASSCRRPRPAPPSPSIVRPCLHCVEHAAVCPLRSSFFTLCSQGAPRSSCVAPACPCTVCAAPGATGSASSFLGYSVRRIKRKRTRTRTRRLPSCCVSALTPDLSHMLRDWGAKVKRTCSEIAANGMSFCLPCAGASSRLGTRGLPPTLRLRTCSCNLARTQPICFSTSTSHLDLSAIEIGEGHKHGARCTRTRAATNWLILGCVAFVVLCGYPGTVTFRGVGSAAARQCCSARILTSCFGFDTRVLAFAVNTPQLRPPATLTRILCCAATAGGTKWCRPTRLRSSRSSTRQDLQVTVRTASHPSWRSQTQPGADVSCSSARCFLDCFADNLVSFLVARAAWFLSWLRGQPGFCLGFHRFSHGALISRCTITDRNAHFAQCYCADGNKMRSRTSLHVNRTVHARVRTALS